jgi:transposase IS116/IS110/IS902 family protein
MWRLVTRVRALNWEAHSMPLTAFRLKGHGSPSYWQASSGKARRHRLNRGGDRQANAALYHIVIARLRHDQQTKDYLVRRLREGKSKKESIRCLKRLMWPGRCSLSSHDESPLP